MCQYQMAFRDPKQPLDSVIWINLYYIYDLMVFAGREFHRLEVLNTVICNQTAPLMRAIEDPADLPTQWSLGASYQSNTTILFAIRKHEDLLSLRNSHYVRSCVLMWFVERNKHRINHEKGDLLSYCQNDSLGFDHVWDRILCFDCKKIEVVFWHSKDGPLTKMFTGMSWKQKKSVWT